MTRINTNVSSLVAQNTLGRSNASLNQALTRLSTGLRINTGKDDPAGLIASENLRSDITSIRRAISNTDRANQVIATADSALGQVSSLLNDIRGLVTESANAGALSEEQIAANQLQLDSSLEALNRIAQTTTFQGRRLLDGSLDFITTAGTNFANLSDLNIDQANLGATGQVGVSINVSQAATQARVEVANIPNTQTAAQGTLDLDIITTQAVASDGQVTFSVISSEAVGATGNTTFTAGTGAAASQASSGAGGNAITLASDPVIQVDAVAGEALDGLAGNLTIDLIDDAGAGVGASPTVVLNGSTLEITAENGVTTGQNIIDAINAFNTGGGAADLSASLSSGTGTNTFATADASGGGDGALTGGTQATTTAQLDIVAEGGNLASALTVDVNFGGAGGSGIAVTGTAGSGGTLTVTLEDGVDHTLDDIATALQNHAGIESASFASNGGLTINSATGGASGTGDTAPSDALVTGGTDETTENVVFDIAGELASGVDGNVEVSFATAGIGAGTTNVVANGVNGSGQNRYIVQLSNLGDVSLSAISTALESISEINTATVAGTPTVSAISTFDAGNDPDNIDTLPGATTLANGVTEVVTAESIQIDAVPGGLNNVNIAVAFANLSGAGTQVVGDSTSGYTLQVDTSVNVSLSNITTALEGLSEVASATVTTGGTGSYQTAITSPQAVPTAVQLQGGADNGLTEDLVIQLSGEIGAEVLSFQAGTSIAQLISGINLVSDATGVSATESTTTAGTLELTSTDFGSNAFVDLKVISEGPNQTPSGVFSTEVGQGQRDEGIDILAAVNGVSATGNGNNLSINTATLDLSTSVEAGFTGTIAFDITGGGALFQLGPDVVSNQQARLGVGSVNTASLGGTSGSLYQLGTGGSADLSSSNLDIGASIVEQAIDKVTLLRGRLGAFQRTTLETNKQALNDTLVNLTDAESSIRDADFAAESAELTRSQILVQSGTTVLSIANQNPQNVLALLR